MRPNIIVILTDDQGYPDLGCTGNPWVRTPHIDAFYGDAVRCTDFHVEPLCTPTRGALMTGRRPMRNGAWATCWGRSILRRSELTLPAWLAQHGYATGLFGKWHLGDNYPFRPFDRGFQHVVAHKGGGVGQTPDFWGNNYFDDTYFHNGKAVPHTGYCTDVWFEEATKFIRTHRGKPFFAFISTNAPHLPYLVAERYRALYAGNPAIPEPAFYGMITNIDENFGRLRQELAQLGLEDNTLLVFMTDNGTSGGCVTDENGFLTSGYNAGLRGQKASYYDGGHRVPFFARWAAGGIAGGRDVKEFSLGLDLFPTVVDLCGLPQPTAAAFDGTSLASLLQGRATALPGDRVHFAQMRQSPEPPEKWTNAVMTRRWRMIHGRELYDIQADPGQHTDISAQHPDVVARLRAEHERWWDEIFPTLEVPCRIVLGHDAENPTCLDAMDVLGDVAWSQTHIVHAAHSTGIWNVAVDQPGRYRFTLRRWPEELGLPLRAALPESDAADIAPYIATEGPPVALAVRQARLGLFGYNHTLTVAPDAAACVFEIDVAATGGTQLEAWFIDDLGVEWGAYYVTAERLSPPA